MNVSALFLTKRHQDTKCCLFLLLPMLLLLASCGGDKPKNADPKNNELPKVATVQAPKLNGDSAYAFVQAQVKFGPRIPNTQAHEACAAYLKNKLGAYCDQVQVQNFTAKGHDGKMLAGSNIIGSINPKATRRVLLAAHWDTRPHADQDAQDPKMKFDGANDGASGAAVLIEIARTIKQSATKPEIGIDIILFDLEDYGKSDEADSYCLGSQYWAKNKHQPGYSAYYGILLDMVGARNAFFAREGHSVQYAPSIVDKVWNTAAALGYGHLFRPVTSVQITDDHYYVNSLANIPMIDIIDYDPNPMEGFRSYWHTRHDNMEVMDKGTLLAVGQTLLQVLYNEPGK